MKKIIKMSIIRMQGGGVSWTNCFNELDLEMQHHATRCKYLGLNRPQNFIYTLFQVDPYVLSRVLCDPCPDEVEAQSQDAWFT